MHVRPPDTSDKLIQTYVKAYAIKDVAGAIYSSSIREMRRVRDLSRFNRATVDSVVHDYLYRWGMIGRPLGRKDHRGWEDALVSDVRSISRELHYFRRVELADADLGRDGRAVLACFEAVERATTPVAAGKLLHLLCPEYFAPWATTSPMRSG